MRGKLRKKKLECGKYSLYIDYYPPVWNPVKKIYTRREFLELYIHIDPQTSLERQENALNNEIAEKIYLKRMKALVLDANGIYNKDILDGDFYIYYTKFIRKKQKDEVESALYESALAHLKKWRPENLKFKDIDELFLEGFKDYLRHAKFLKSDVNTLSANSKAVYYDKIAAVVNQAFLDRYLTEDYTLKVKRLPNEDSLAERLDPEDIQLLIDNPCADELVFRSSIFALLSGFRFSAVEILKFEHFHYSMNLDSWYVQIIDPKPGRLFKHYISKEAMNIVGNIKQGSEMVFNGLTYYRMRKELIKWFDSVGLKNKARFHNWRRRYASNLIDNDVDIYVVKEMLNHKSVKTTEIYTDAGAKTKASAAKKMKLSFTK